jgi:hypothetical protein
LLIVSLSFDVVVGRILAGDQANNFGDNLASAKRAGNQLGWTWEAIVS